MEIVHSCRVALLYRVNSIGGIIPYKFVIRPRQIKRDLNYGFNFMIEKEMSDSVMQPTTLIEIYKV